MAFIDIKIVDEDGTNELDGEIKTTLQRDVVDLCVETLTWGENFLTSASGKEILKRLIKASKKTSEGG